MALRAYTANEFLTDRVIYLLQLLYQTITLD